MSRFVSLACYRYGRLTPGKVALAFAANRALGVAAAILTYLLLTAGLGG